MQVPWGELNKQVQGETQLTERRFIERSVLLGLLLGVLQTKHFGHARGQLGNALHQKVAFQHGARLSTPARAVYPSAVRYLPPIVFFVTAIVVHTLKTSRSDRVILFPLMDTLFPSTAGDLAAQGEASVHTLLAVGALTLCFAVFGTIQGRRAQLDD